MISLPLLLLSLLSLSLLLLLLLLLFYYSILQYYDCHFFVIFEENNVMDVFEYVLVEIKCYMPCHARQFPVTFFFGGIYHWLYLQNTILFWFSSIANTKGIHLEAAEPCELWTIQMLWGEGCKPQQGEPVKEFPFFWWETRKNCKSWFWLRCSGQKWHEAITCWLFT